MINSFYTSEAFDKLSLRDKLSALYNEVISLDEIAGQLDPEFNEIIDKQRAGFYNMIKELEGWA